MSNQDHRFYTKLNGKEIEGGVLCFFKSSCMTVESFSDDSETGENYRAHWMQLPGRDIQITKIERNDARPGKDDYWVIDLMSRLEVIALENMIAEQLEREQTSEYQRAVEQAEAAYDPFAEVAF